MRFNKTFGLALSLAVTMSACNGGKETAASSNPPEVGFKTMPPNVNVVVATSASPAASQPSLNVAMRCAAIASFQKGVLLEMSGGYEQLKEFERQRFDQYASVEDNARFLSFEIGDQKGLNTRQVESQILQSRPEGNTEDYFKRACLPAFAKK